MSRNLLDGAKEDRERAVRAVEGSEGANRT